jgi:hypothetical protein
MMELRGFRVDIENTRPDIATSDVVARLDVALELLETYVPHHVRRMRRDFSRILVKRYECRGAYFPEERTCMVELTFTVNRDFTPTQIAATILHEAMHARLDAIGYPFTGPHRARQERFCRRAEIEFGLVAPDGEPVVQRALAALDESDEGVAPMIDKVLAAQRIAEADRNALLETPRLGERG